MTESSTRNVKPVKSKGAGKSSKPSDKSSYVKIDRIGKVSIYKRGKNYWLYFRDRGKSVRKRVYGNLATTRATASQVNVDLEQKRPSPFNYETKPIFQVIDDYLEYCRLARGARVKTHSRYRAALDHFKEFIKQKPHLTNIDQVNEAVVDEFVKFMHHKSRVRSGEANGVKGKYTSSGIAFILSTCRSLCNYAMKRKLLPPYKCISSKEVGQ